MDETEGTEYCWSSLIITVDHSLSKIMWKKLNFSILKGLINWNEKASVSDLPIAHFHDDVTRALHAGICSQEKNNMAARSGGLFTCCVPGCFTNSKRDTHLSFYVFPKEKNLRRSWLHSISRKNFKPTTGHRVCSLHFKGGKKPTWTMFLLFFLWQNLLPGGHPNQGEN